jgi:5-methylcytosine-specific restriction endonuclease McrA
MYLDKAKRQKLKNPEKYKEYHKSYRTSNNGRLRLNIAREKRRARIFNTDDGTITHSAIINIFISQDYMCAYCKKNVRNKYHIDHIKFLSNGGQHTITNIQILCPTCNLRKPRSI